MYIPDFLVHETVLNSAFFFSISYRLVSFLPFRLHFRIWIFKIRTSIYFTWQTFLEKDHFTWIFLPETVKTLNYYLILRK